VPLGRSSRAWIRCSRENAPASSPSRRFAIGVGLHRTLVGARTAAPRTASKGQPYGRYEKPKRSATYSHKALTPGAKVITTKWSLPLENARQDPRDSECDLAKLLAVKRRTVSLSDEALEALDRIAKANHTTVSGVVEAAGLILNEGGPGAEALKRRLVPDRRGGDRRLQQPNA
jgi:hypothetical protein